MRSQGRNVPRPLGLSALLIVAAAGLVLGSCSRGPPSRGSSLPPPAEPAFLVRHPAKLGPEPDLARWAPVRRAALARRAPDGDAHAVAVVRSHTPEGTRNLVEVLGRAQRASGSLWVRVRLPSGVGGRLGWVERDVLGGYGYVRARLVVDLHGLRATLLRGGRPVFSTKIGVGQPATPTPTGRFYIRNRLTRYRSPQYGPIAFGTSARSPVLTDWPAGGFVGIHGTDRPDLLPGRVSHGCIRMPNESIRRLARLMPIGTPITIQ